MNRKVILIHGKPGTGKTASIRNLVRDHGDQVAYINIDCKEDDLPFNIDNVGFYKKLQNPLELLPGLRSLDGKENIKYVVIDTFSEWASLLEYNHVLTTGDTRKAWQGVYATTIRSVLEYARFESSKNYIFLSHSMESNDSFIPLRKAELKGSLGKRGLEYYFPIVLETTKYDRDDGPSGYGLITGSGEGSVGTSARSPIGLFYDPVFKSNDILKVFRKIDDYNVNDHLDEFIDEE